MPKVLMRGDHDGSDKSRSIYIACLLGSGLWDFLTPEERRAFTEHGEVLDTLGGRQLAAIIEKSQGVRCQK